MAVETRVQEIVPADGSTADRLGIRVGEQVDRLSPEFRDDLMKADIPIGKIIKQHRIKARRGEPHEREFLLMAVRKDACYCL